jgi:hypothetical protein
MVADEKVLVRRRHHDGAETIVWIAKCSEDLSSDSEIRMPHVFPLLGAGEGKRDATKL